MTQLHAGKLRGVGNEVWHSRENDADEIVYWCGSWHERTPEELYLECLTILADLHRNHPGIETSHQPRTNAQQGNE